MLLYFLEWSIQCRIQNLRWAGRGVGDGHPNPEKRRAVSEKIFSTVGHQYGLKIRGRGPWTLPLDPSLQ